jgi:hypothetical protein
MICDESPAVYLLLRRLVDEGFVDQTAIVWNQKTEIAVSITPVSPGKLLVFTTHVDGPNCGHEAVPHGDHMAQMIKDYIHRPPETHCDDQHGKLSIDRYKGNALEPNAEGIQRSARLTRLSGNAQSAGPKKQRVLECLPNQSTDRNCRSWATP